MKFCTSVPNLEVAMWFDAMGFKQVFKVEEADFVVFPGGGDIDARFYHDSNILQSYGTNPFRDTKEFKLVAHCVKNKKRMIGICRGAQLLNVAAGGFLIQDVENHAGPDHLVRFADGALETVNSRHHQMMYPWNLPRDQYVLIGWATDLGNTYRVGDKMLDRDKNEHFKLTQVRGYYNAPFAFANEKNKGKQLYYNKDIKDTFLGIDKTCEPEVILFPRIGSLAIQYHPEGMDNDKYTNAMLTTEALVDAFLDNKL